ncbi:MAG: type VII toxin-antitoxin system MntA family adenylyltransferase antitoxin [Actinomycetota bacterium]
MDDHILKALREAGPAAFDQTPVVFAFLFGSRASGRSHRGSDVDVAVFVDPDLDPERFLDLRLALAGRLEEAAGVGPVEVVVLNEAALPVRGRAVRDGVVFYSRDEPTRVRYQSRTLREFFDFEIHARRLDQELLRGIASGRR